ncbi:hypothetical protein [Flagellimonas aurea]|uniref:hypothetical protein n=1 Tax=Flagellimonas aurea TaxID=2915619 RepID=UPI0035D07F8F
MRNLMVNLKINRNTIFILILFSTSFSLTGQNLFEEKILGTWEHQQPDKNKELLLDSGDTSNTVSNSKSLYLFQKKGVVDIKEPIGQFKTEYAIVDSILSLGSRKFRIIEFGDNELIIEEVGEMVIFKKKLEFNRTTKFIEPIPAFEEIFETFEDGGPKVSGIKENGFKTGVWTEWHKNGNVKSVTYYNRDAPLMNAVFDEKGNLISKNWFDINSNSMRTD